MPREKRDGQKNTWVLAATSSGIHWRFEPVQSRATKMRGRCFARSSVGERGHW